VFLITIQIIIIIRYRIKIKFLIKLIKNPTLLDDYRWYAKQLDKKPLTDDEKREAFERAIIKEAKYILKKEEK